MVDWLMGYWKRLPRGFRWNIEDSFFPEDIAERLLPYEEPQLVIKLAWYRDIVGHLFFPFARVIFIVTILLAVAIGYWGFINGLTIFYGLIPIGLFVVVLAYAIRERIEYNQWRLLKTDARLIISIPQPGGWPLVDNIELNGLPRVVDTNWSRNPVWRVFQFFTGARDLS